MKQIDELIAVLVARRADALILHSGQAAQLIFSGTPAPGAIVPAPLLRSMLREIVPSTQQDLLRTETAFQFSHACPDGLMRVKIERHGIDFHVVVEPYSSPSSRLAASSSAPTAPRVFVPPVENKPTYQPYQPPVDQGLATPAYPIYTKNLPGYGSAPFVNGGGAPNAPTSAATPNVAGSNATAPIVKTPMVSAPIFMASNLSMPNFPAPLPRAPVLKPTMNLGAVAFATIVFCSCLPFFVSLWSFAALWTLFGVSALVILLDSYLVGVEEGLIYGWGDCGPWTWFFVCLFFGFVGIPAYVATRPIYQKALILKPPP